MQVAKYLPLLGLDGQILEAKDSSSDKLPAWWHQGQLQEVPAIGHKRWWWHLWDNRVKQEKKVSAQLQPEKGGTPCQMNISIDP